MKNLDDESQEILSVLNERELKILELRYGYPKKTLREVGELFGVRGDRIRCIQNVAQRKLHRKRIILRKHKELGLV